MRLLEPDMAEDARISPLAPEKGLLKRAAYLPEADRLLMDLYFRRQLTRLDIARLLGQPAGTVSRRLVRLSVSLRDPLVIALIESPDQSISELHRAIGIAHFLCRRPVAHLAREHQMTGRRVRQILEYLRGWYWGKEGRHET